MCDVCTAVEDRGDKPYGDLTLVTKSNALADAFLVILRETGAGKEDEAGNPIPDDAPYVDGNTIVIPWAGSPEFAFAVAVGAVASGVADHAEGQAMVDRAEADILGISVAELVAKRTAEEAEKRARQADPLRALTEALSAAVYDD